MARKTIKDRILLGIIYKKRKLATIQDRIDVRIKRSYKKYVEW